MQFLLALFVFLSCVTANAFPELVKHGYPNCMACHVSPNGGGVLTEYGRALSKELLSTWGRPNEENFLYALPANQRIVLGGDLRWIEVQNHTTKRTRSLVMQRDLEAALTVGKFTVDATAGVEDPQQRNENQFVSRRHYLIYQASDSTSIRAGRFYPAFGLLLPEHSSYVRRGLGWDQGMESYGLEVAWQTEKFNLFGTAIMGRPDDKTLNRESGLALTAAYNPTEKIKVGTSYYYGETGDVIHHYAGPWAILGFTEKLYLLTQITGIRTFLSSATDPTMGMVNYNRLDYEFFRGMHVFLTQEFSQTNFSLNSTRADTLSLGFQFFPRPHFEFQTVWQKVYEQGLSGSPQDRLLLLAHFYP